MNCRQRLSAPVRSERIPQAWRRTRLAALVGAASLTAVLVADPAFAQDAEQASDDGGEIIVTARKREETLQSVPVIATVLGGEQLERLRVTDLKGVASLTPGLVFAESFLASGTQVSLRGVGTMAIDPGVDQSVSLNIDGMQFTQGLAFVSGMFDVGQVEVLKGPQALFFGKSSVGGVISLRSADPTSKVEGIGRASYDFEARERQFDLILSGPVTDTLKLRFAGRFSNSDGFFYNRATAQPGTGAQAPPTDRLSPAKRWILRGTALWEPSESFDARLKVNYVKDRIEMANVIQFVSCPDGTTSLSTFGYQYIGGGEDCRLDRTIRAVGMDPAVYPGNPALGAVMPNGGIPFLDTKQWFGTLELNYRTDSLTFTSVTGYYNIDALTLSNSSSSTFAGPTLVTDNAYTRDELTQELRVNSELDGPFNFTLGGFYQDAKITQEVIRYGNTVYLQPGTSIPFPALRGWGTNRLDIKTYSLFAQARFLVLPELELSVGARVTDETRKAAGANKITGTAVPVTLGVPRIQSTSWSPEFTANYRPNDRLTVFASYKKGYKSGSFNIVLPPTTGQNTSFGDEQVEGFEAGVKSRLLDRQLTLNLAAYDYKYRGLQVGTQIPPVAGGNPLSRTINAGKSHVYGVELDMAYRPKSIEGLALRTSINWNHARYVVLNNISCWAGQTVAEGCNRVPNAAGLFTAQDLSGTPMVRAPKWQGNFGFTYNMPVGNDMSLVVSNSNQISSKYLTLPGRRADFFASGFLKVDLGVTLKGPKDRWEVAATGRNLTNKLSLGNCTASDFQNGLILGGTTTGGTTRGPAGIAEVACSVDRGRELWLSLTIRPFN